MPPTPPFYKIYTSSPPWRRNACEAAQAMALTAGTKLGPYEIADQLGAAGSLDSECQVSHICWHSPASLLPAILSTGVSTMVSHNRFSITVLVSLCFALPATLYSQSDPTAKTFHIFPQMVDGVANDGTEWASLLTATNVENRDTTCTFTPTGGRVSTARLPGGSQFTLERNGGTALWPSAGEGSLARLSGSPECQTIDPICLSIDSRMLDRTMLRRFEV